jgi:hypothetical protein
MTLRPRPDFCRPIPRTLRCFSQGTGPLRDAEKQSASENGYAIEGPVGELKRSVHGIRAMLGPRHLDFDTVYPAMGCDVRSDLASKLGAATTDVGCLKVDGHRRATIKRALYAAGGCDVGPSPNRSRHGSCCRCRYPNSSLSATKSTIARMIRFPPFPGLERTARLFVNSDGRGRRKSTDRSTIEMRVW